MNECGYGVTTVSVCLSVCRTCCYICEEISDGREYVLQLSLQVAAIRQCTDSAQYRPVTRVEVQRRSFFTSIVHGDDRLASSLGRSILGKY
jgi:hypothetical protein